MKFRQRMAWLMVSLYLMGTFAFFYYMFEINEHFNKYALDHVEKYHSTKSASEEDNRNIFRAFYEHVADIPLSVWLLIFILPYLQIFMMMLACTRAEPRHSWAYLWPGLVYQKYQQMFGWQSSSIAHLGSTPKSSLNGHSNSHTVIHT